jgi:hypothetical protein
MIVSTDRIIDSRSDIVDQHQTATHRYKKRGYFQEACIAPLKTASNPLVLPVSVAKLKVQPRQEFAVKSALRES